MPANTHVTALSTESLRALSTSLQHAGLASKIWGDTSTAGWLMDKTKRTTFFFLIDAMRCQHERKSEVIIFLDFYNCCSFLIDTITFLNPFVTLSSQPTKARRHISDKVLRNKSFQPYHEIIWYSRVARLFIYPC